jgi:hypothetical protein
MLFANASRSSAVRVNRVVANITAQDPGLADKFYGQVLGLDLLMDMGWIRTFGSKTNVSAQVSFMSEGGLRHARARFVYRSG